MTDVSQPSVSDAKAGAPVIKTFQGASSVDQMNLAKGTWCPDCNGAASNSHFVEFINRVFSVYDKKTGTLVTPRVSDTQFWQDAGIASPGGIIDPRIVFIPYVGQNGQWLAVQIDMSRVLIATTDPQDPQADPRPGKWKASVFDLPNNDFTMLGYDANGFYIGVNSGNAPPKPPPPPKDKRSPQFAFIPRAKALAYPPRLDDIKIVGPLHYEDFGDNLYPVIDRSGGNPPYGTLIGVDNLSKNHLTYALFSPQSGTIVKSGKIEVEPFEPVPDGYRVKQPDGQAYNAVLWYNDGLVAAPMSDGSNIWLAQTVLIPKYQTLAVRWYRLAIDLQTRVPSLATWNQIFQSQYDTFNPSILAFGKDDYIVVSVSRSGFGVPGDPTNPLCGNLGAYVALVLEADPTRYLLYVLQAGQVSNYFPPGGQRWGDYSTICRDPDPAMARRVWTVNQYALTGGNPTTSQWGNIIASVDVPVP